MGLWNSVEDIFSGGGRSDIDDAYNTANQYMAPYTKAGAEDYNAFRTNVNQTGDRLAPFQNAGDWQYNHINQSPVDFYNSIMSGYTESPDAKYLQEQALKASNAGASASGMVGSGSFMKALQENAASIAQRDRQQFFNNVLDTNRTQMGYLENEQNQQSEYNRMQQYLTQLGYGAATGSGTNAINQGVAQSGIGRETVGDIASMVGFGGGKGLFGSSQQSNSGNGMSQQQMAQIISILGGV